MPTPFRPNLEALDSRELPSVAPFTFTLADGTVVSGSFDYDAAAVDATLASQQVPVSDMVVALNGQPAVLAAELAAPVATFAQGQLQGVSLTAVAVAGNATALIDTAGTLSPISVTAPQRQPLNAIPLPIDGGPTVDWAAMINSYNQDLGTLSMYTMGPNPLDGKSGVLITLMNRQDYWLSRRDDAVKLANAATSPLWRAIYQEYMECALTEVRGAAVELAVAYDRYRVRHDEVVARYWTLKSLLPANLRDDLTEPPAKFSVPEAYYQYLPNPLV